MNRAAAVRNFLLAITAVLMFATASIAQYTPLYDSYTKSTNATDAKTNYGAATTLNVDGATEIAYLQFNLSDIPSGSIVSQATLKLYVNSVTTAGSLNVDYVNGLWTESTITYNDSPALGNTIIASVPVSTADKNQYILINVTSAVQAWLDGSQPNYGIALVANGTFNATFDSKENTTTSHPAEVDIVFANSGGTITGVSTASSSGLIGGGKQLRILPGSRSANSITGPPRYSLTIALSPSEGDLRTFASRIGGERFFGPDHEKAPSAAEVRWRLAPLFRTAALNSLGPGELNFALR